MKGEDAKKYKLLRIYAEMHNWRYIFVTMFVLFGLLGTIGPKGENLIKVARLNFGLFAILTVVWISLRMYIKHKYFPHLIKSKKKDTTEKSHS